MTDADDAENGDLGHLQFARLSGEDTAIRLNSGFARIQGLTQAVNLPQSLMIDPLPTRFVLYPAHPNPFNPQTSISFFLPEPAAVRLRIFDLLGQEVRTLLETDLRAGRHSSLWDARDATGKRVASGVYLVEVDNGKAHQVAKLLLVQ